MTAEKMAETRQPDKVALNPIQAKRLAALTGLPADELAHRTVAELAGELRWQINPDLFLFERVCGRVVKPDPATGLKYPVPGATVNVFDTDCDWIWFFPPGWPWGWIFPFGLCETELVATTTTDECGRFCVWIPRFDIDWILTWRRERICFADLFRRPSAADLLGRVLGEGTLPQPFPGGPNPPNPPDPESLAHLLRERQDLAAAIGPGIARRIQAGALSQLVGAPAGEGGLLAGAAFTEPVPPPLHHELRAAHQRGDHQSVQRSLGVSAEQAKHVDLSRWYGPFLRCIDIAFPEWLPVLEVPDITIQVTQDTDGDGDQEVIFDQAFGAPWSIPVPNLELDAAPFALSLPSPGCGPDFPCTDTPAIQMVGLMPVDPGYLEPTHGFATRPNPARVSGQESGMPTYPSTTPFEGTLQLYGCVHLGDAQYYRILAEYAPGDGLGGAPVFGSPQPLMEQWPMYHFGPFTKQIQHPDADGWYLVLDDTWSPLHLLMNWNPEAMGSYRLTLQLGTMAAGSIQVQSSAAPVVFAVDNTVPTMHWDLLQWRYQGDLNWTKLIPDLCPLISRDPSRAIEVNVAFSTSTPHLRNVVLQAGGCGGAAPSPPGVEHWHTNELDNSWSNSTVYTIPAYAQAGCYGWTVTVFSRAFNPAGDNNGLAYDWYYDPYEIWSTLNLAVAIVDA
jgi:hypothetical protein